MKDKYMWFYSICGEEEYKVLTRSISTNPTDEEFNKIAQELLADYGCTEKDCYISFGKGTLLTADGLGACLGEDIIEILENRAGDVYGVEDYLFEGAKKEDIEDLDRRIAQVLKEWDEERTVMSDYYEIDVKKDFYYEPSKEERE